MSDADDFVTIQLTGEWPIRVRRKEWPVISFAVGYDPDASNPDWSNIVLVRRGQVAEHGTSYIAHAMAFKKRKVTQADLETEDLVPDREGGYLMRGEIGAQMLVQTLAKLGGEMEMPEEARRCARGLPPRDPEELVSEG